MFYDEDLPRPSHSTTSVTSFYPLPRTPDISYINDYLPWSIVNLIFGWGFFGIIPLIFSIICRNNKNDNNLSGAHTMSRLAFIFNILITIGGLIGWTIFFIFISIYITAINSIT